MVVEPVALVLGADQPADEVITLPALCPDLGHLDLDRVVERLGRLHRRDTRLRRPHRIHLRPGQDRQRPGGVLLDPCGVVREADHRVDQADRKVQAEVHQVGPPLWRQRGEVFVPHDAVHLRPPLVDRLGHEDRLQQRTCAPMLFAVHAGQDQPVEKSAQTFGDEPTGEAGSVPQHRHHVLVLEDRERGTVRVQPGDVGHPQARHEVLRDHRGLRPLRAVDRVQVHVCPPVVVRHPGEGGFKVGPGGGTGHCRLVDVDRSGDSALVLSPLAQSKHQCHSE